MAVFQRWPLCRRVLVNLVDGRAFDAVLYDKRGPLLELRDAKLLEPDTPAPVALDGTVIVERSKVSFIQVRD